MDTLSKYLKKDKSSGSLLYSILKKDLDSIDFATFPVDLSGDLSKKLAINNGVGAVAISNDNIPIVFVDATITDVAKALKKQNIPITDTPNNELLVILTENGSHFKAVLQNSTHHIVYNMHHDSSQGFKEKLETTVPSTILNFCNRYETLSMLFEGLLMQGLKNHIPSNCVLLSKNYDNTQIHNGIFERNDNYVMPQDSLSIKHDGIHAIRFKVTNEEFDKVKEKILEIDNHCQAKTLFYALIPDEKTEENCFTSINRLVKAANIDTSYMKYFFDYQLKRPDNIFSLHFYHYKHEELSYADKFYDVSEHFSSYIYEGVKNLAILGTTFFVTNFLMPGYAMTVSAGLASYLFNPSASKILESPQVITDKNFEILPCNTDNWQKQQCTINKNFFDMCVKEYGTEYPASLDNNGVFQRTIVQNVWEEEGIHFGNGKPENKSYCIEHHVVKYYNEMPGLIDDFNNNIQDFLS